MWRRRPRVAQQPLLYFVHIPKTGGSTVISHLESFSRNGHGHIEAFVSDDARWRRAMATADWLSGHTQWEQLEPRLAAVPERQVRLFTCVREPTAHIMSELNWLIEIAHRGQRFYDGHPPMAREASEFIRARGPHTPYDVIACFERFPLLFREVQFHVAVGSWLPSSEQDIPQALQRYERIVTSNQVDELVRAMTGSAPKAGVRLNASSYHFDTTLFETAEVRDFLRQFNRRDELLYAAVRSAA